MVVFIILTYLICASILKSYLSGLVDAEWSEYQTENETCHRHFLGFLNTACTFKYLPVASVLYELFTFC